MVFHRIVPNFLIQTGALRQPTVPNSSGPSGMDDYRKLVQAEEALERRKYEVHSRLRFNHRCQLAMALGVDDQDDTKDLQPQFFITLDEAPYLDGKHVLFGTVAGPTIFNAIRIGGSEVDESSNQPVDMEHAPRIKSVKIVDNPVHVDLVPVMSVPWRVASQPEKVKKKKRRKGKLDVNVLSFGDEMDDGELPVTGIKSSHDVLDSKKLSKHVNKETAERVRKRSPEAVKEPVLQKRKRPREEEQEETEPEDTRISYIKSREAAEANAESYEPPEPAIPDALGTDASLKKEKKESIVELRRSKYMSKSQTSKKKREENTLAKLMAFQSKVRDQVGAGKHASQKDGAEISLASRMARRAEQATESKDDDAPTYHGQILESDDEEQGKKDWLGTRFKCRKHMDHQARDPELGGDGRSMHDYQVLDARQRPDDSKDDRGHHKKHAKDHNRDRKDGHRHHKKR